MRMLVVICLCILTGCASKSDLDSLRYDLAELKTSYGRVDKDLATLRSETKEGLEKSVINIQGDVASVRKSAADLQANMEAMKVDMQVVSGKLDDAALAAKKPAEEVGFLREDMERRFAAVEGKLARLEKSVEEQKKSFEAKATELATSPEALYQKGLETYKSGNTEKARELLTKFIEGSPSHELAANAHYWLGETFYSEKKYDQAILEFQEVIKNFPGKEKVPSAMLKQAMAFKEIGDLKSARYIYTKLTEDHPTSSEATAAREKLKGFKASSR